MPILEYKCLSCGKKQDRIVKNKDEQPSCINCSEVLPKSLKKIYRTSFQLNGNFH